MKRFGLFLFAVVMVCGIGCGGGSDTPAADVQKDGNGHATWWSSGKIHAWGTVINAGDATADNVTLEFVFLSANKEYFRESRNIGSIAAGASVNFEEWLQGPKIADVHAISWSYTVSWGGKA